MAGAGRDQDTMLSFCPFLLALSRKCQKLDRIKKKSEAVVSVNEKGALPSLINLGDLGPSVKEKNLIKTLY